MKKIILFLIFSSFLSGCKELTGDHTGANDLPFQGKFVGGLLFVELEGGKSLLNGTMNQGDSHSFRLKFQLRDGESLRYFFFANKDLNDGVIVTFSRDSNEVWMKLSLNGVSDTQNLGALPETIDLLIDIHNDHEDAHLLAWQRQNDSDIYDDSEGCVEAKSCLYNTESYTFPNEGPWGSQGRAQGNFWGIQGERSRVLLLEGPLKAISDA